VPAILDTIKVLVVDDELGIRTSISRILQKLTLSLPDQDAEVSFDVGVAETAEEALAIIKETPPEILLLDNKLPGMSGIELLEQILPLNLDIYTVIITAYASIETAVRATKQGAYDLLPKPFTPGELKGTIEKVTRHLLVSKRAKELAAEKRKVRFQFISVLAHELKAPINAIEGYLRIVKDKSAGDKPEVYEELMERCLVRTEYMRKMISDLLDLTRIESGERARKVEECDLVEAAKSALDTFVPEATRRGIAMQLHADTPLIIKADRTELDIVMNNLVSNAVKYNRDNGRVDIYIDREGNMAKIVVKDTGIGMEPEECKRIFHDFVRIKNEKTTRILGSGLGLSTVKKIATMYDGDATVASEPEKGSTFTVTLRMG